LHQDGEAGFAEGLELLADCCSAMECSFIRSGSEAAKQRWSGWRVPYLGQSVTFSGSGPRGCKAYRGALLLIDDVWRQSRKHHGQS
jgi:hypothetical protein